MRRIDASDRKLTADVSGEVETKDGVLVIRRINVAMRLVAPESSRETVERTHSIYVMHCPLYRTLHKAIQLTSSCEVVGPAAFRSRGLTKGEFEFLRSRRSAPMMHAGPVSNLQVAENSTAKEAATILLLTTPSHVVADYFDEGEGVLMVDETASDCFGNPEKIRSSSEIS